MDSNDLPTMPTGYIPSDPDEVKVMFPDATGTFGSTPAFGKVAGDTSDLYLWNFCKKVFKANLPTHKQVPNDCVSHAFGEAIEYLQCAMIANNQRPDLQFNFVSTEAIYALARKQNGQFLPGCVPEGPHSGGGTRPTYALKALSQYGVLPRDAYPDYDLTEYDPQLAVKFGNGGLPSGLEARTRDYPLKADNQTAVRTFEEAAAAIRAGYPVVVGSHIGFFQSRDGDGFCARDPSGGPFRAGHAMLFIGVRGQSGLCCLNSWGDDYFHGPAPDGMPLGAFWVHAQDVPLMLREGEAYAVSFFDGFPPVPWNV